MSPAEYAEALGSFASGVTVLTLREDLDDIGTTVTAFMAVSADPPLVAVGLAADSYVFEALQLAETCVLSLLAADQSVLASRFAAAGRPSARLLLDGVPHDRAAHSAALVITEGVAALDCRVNSTFDAGDHVLVVLQILEVLYVAENRKPLIRYRSRYRREL
ncbi:MAG: flavin reductase [Geodermatophilaceae bacterium]|jgi:flavin reductase (DIM6/NTAB) family NADH-FMN oxidoreductase RutF|nr:flavin reductase [Geodermatophilaceae bacterium]MDQ3475899.1 flavin reductase family protein [Actinomycetota bacterium]